ncbi:hypothetical protein PRIPAC_78106 [Pristionchus pacificus]|nr:hypothetical protein PRIPAC_78106 [Pristionchus pacificus]
MDDHVIFTLQALASALYVITIFSLRQWMVGREPFKLQVPIAVWNFSIALVSLLCAIEMTPEFMDAIFKKGFNASLCSTRDGFFTGRNGLAVFVLLLAQLPAFLDTLFIVLRKQKLLFFHWYHHALTLCFSWYAYSAGAPSGRHLLYFNAIIHAMMYSYYFLTSLNIRPPLIVSKFITLAEISHFFFIVYMLVHLTMLVYVYQEPCQFDSTCLALTWMMDLSYLYLFIEFYMKKYHKKPKNSANYYFLTTLKIRPPPIVARCITIAQIVQFVYIFYGLAHQTALIYVFEMPCLQDPTGLALIWFMDLTYLYLFTAFYMNKYKGAKKPSENANNNVKKID